MSDEKSDLKSTDAADTDYAERVLHAVFPNMDLKPADAAQGEPGSAKPKQLLPDAAGHSSGSHATKEG